MLQQSPASIKCPVFLRRWRLVTCLLLGLVLLATSDGARPSPTYAAVTLKPGDFLLGDWLQQRIWAVDGSSGTATQLSTNRHIHYPKYVAAGPNGEVYFVDSSYFIDNFTERAVVARVDPATGIPTVITMLSSSSSAYIGYSGLLVDSSGFLIVINQNSILRVDPTSGQRTTISSGGLLINADGIALERDGSILTTAGLTSDANAPRRIVRVRASTRAQEIVSSGSLVAIASTLAVGPDGSVFVPIAATRLDPGYLLRVDPQAGAQQVVAQMGDDFQVGGITADGSGTLYLSAISRSGGSIIRLNPVTSGQSFLGAGAFVNFPGGIAMVPGTVPLPCPSTPRPPISVRTSAPGNGRLLVSVHADGNPNAIRNIQLGTLRGNAVLEDQPAISIADATFTLRRTGPGAVTLPFTVTDACGDWSTFVGGGPNAF